MSDHELTKTHSADHEKNGQWIYFDFTGWSIDSDELPITEPYRIDVIAPEELKFSDTTTMLLTVTFDSHEMIQEILSRQEKIENMLTKIVSADESEGPLSVTDSEAKALIVDYIAELDTFYPSDIAYDLNLDYEQVCKVLELLKSEGAIGNIE